MKPSLGYRQIRDEVARALDCFHARVMRGSGRSTDEIRRELYPTDSATLGAAKVKRLLRTRPDLSLRALMTVRIAVTPAVAARSTRSKAKKP